MASPTERSVPAMPSASGGLAPTSRLRRELDASIGMPTAEKCA